MANLQDIESFLNEELKITEFTDVSHNGLQVENSGEIFTVCTGVDASIPFFERAAERDADLLICHHGISWGDSLKKITGLNYKRLDILMKNDMALYACHLPLDAHPQLGNNARICVELGLFELQPFGQYNGTELGFCGVLPEPVPYQKFKQQAERLFGNIVGTMDFGTDTIRTVAVVSGGAASEIEEAAQVGVDVYLSGEPKLTAYNLAMEHGINAIFAGHYATETFGVKALAELLEQTFDVETEFIDMAVPF